MCFDQKINGAKNISYDAGTYHLQNSYVYYKFDLREVQILHFGFNV